MGRPGLSLHRKTRRLAQELDSVVPGHGRALARGSLELIWDGAYEAGDPFIGEAMDVEARAEWHGPPGKLCAALVTAGGKNRPGFIEEGGSEFWPDGEPGTYRVHDLFDHAPDYVEKRLRREEERRANGRTISELRAEAGRKGAAATKAKRQTSGHLPDSNRQLATRLPDSNRQSAVTPAPAPAPAPAQAQPKNLQNAESALPVARDALSPEKVSEPWPEELAERLRGALAVDDAVWARFLAQVDGEPLSKRISGATEYLRRKPTRGEHPPAYVARMIRDGAGLRTTAPSAPERPAWEAAGHADEESWLQGQYRNRFDLPLPEPLPADWRERLAPVSRASGEVPERHEVAASGSN